jgi:type VI secretion system VasD/TssJ family lipoprotein
MNRCIAVVAAALAAAVLAGCGGLTQVSYKVYKPLNVNQQGQSTPVTVKLLFLKDNGKFKSKTVDELWEDPKKALEDDLIGMKQFTIQGDDDAKSAKLRAETFAELKPEVQYIGIVGAFSKAVEGHPRQLVVSVADAGAGVFHFTDYSVQLKPE